MGGEDFSYMLEARPGAFIFIGNGDTAGLHNPAYDFNDEVIPDRLLLLGAAGRDGDAGDIGRPGKGCRFDLRDWVYRRSVSGPEGARLNKIKVFSLHYLRFESQAGRDAGGLRDGKMQGPG